MVINLLPDENIARVTFNVRVRHKRVLESPRRGF